MRNTWMYIFALIILYSCEKAEPYVDVDTPFGWIVGEKTVMKTEDGGDTWKDMIPDLMLERNTTYEVIGFSNTCEGLLCGDIGSVYETANAVDWFGTTTAMGATSLSFPDTNIVYFSGPSLQNNYYSIDFIDAGKGWGVANYGLIEYTGDSAKTWVSQISNQTENLNYITHNQVDVNYTLWVVGDNGVLLKSDNFGDTWVTISCPVNENLKSIFFTNELNGYIVGDAGSILTTTDGGINWVQKNSGTTNNLKSIGFSNSILGIAVGEKGTVLKTSDAGETWTILDLEISTDLKCVCFVKRRLKVQQ